MEDSCSRCISLSWAELVVQASFFFSPFFAPPPTHASPVVSRFPDTAKTPREELMKRQSMTGALFDRSLIAFRKSSLTRIASPRSAVTSNLLVIVKLCWVSIKTGSKNLNFQIHNDAEIDDYPVCQRRLNAFTDHICAVFFSRFCFFFAVVYVETQVHLTSSITTIASKLIKENRRKSLFRD